MIVALLVAVVLIVALGAWWEQRPEPGDYTDSGTDGF